MIERSWDRWHCLARSTQLQVPSRGGAVRVLPLPENVRRLVQGEGRLFWPWQRGRDWVDTSWSPQNPDWILKPSMPLHRAQVPALPPCEVVSHFLSPCDVSTEENRSKVTVRWMMNGETTSSGLVLKSLLPNPPLLSARMLCAISSAKICETTSRVRSNSAWAPSWLLRAHLAKWWGSRRTFS